jgi:hypothetical protein
MLSTRWNSLWECLLTVIFFVGYFIMVSVATLQSIEWKDDCWMMNCKGLGRKQSWPNWGSIPAFAWKGYRKPQNISVRTAEVEAMIQTEHLLNMSVVLPVHQLAQFCSVKLIYLGNEVFRAGLWSTSSYALECLSHFTSSDNLLLAECHQLIPLKAQNDSGWAPSVNAAKKI